MYLSEFCDVKYEEKHNVTFVEWKKFCCQDDYRRPLEYALDIIKNHEGCKGSHGVLYRRTHWRDS